MTDSDLASGFDHRDTTSDIIHPPRSAPVMRGQQHARKALERIKCIPSPLREEYKDLAQGFPAMIKQSGLAPALGNLHARSVRDGQITSQGLFLDDLAHILAQGDGKSLHHAAINSPISEYARMTREALAAADWLKRFSQAFLSGKPSARAEANSAEAR